MDTARSRFFFSNAWRSMATTRNLFGKLCLLALIQFVPILGQIVALGYMLGWAREAAWKMETPLPAHVFGRDDPSFWARGALGFVVCFLYGLIQTAALGILSIAYGGVVGAFDLGDAAFAVATAVFVVVEIAVALLLAAFEIIGLVRMAIYNSFGAAFQWGVACRMIGREFGGLFKLFWTAVLALLIFEILSLIVAVALVPALVGIGIGIPFATAVVAYGEITESAAILISSVLGASSIMGLASVVVWFFLDVAALLVQALLWRAMGSWVALFDVASWGGRHDRLPYQADAGGLPSASDPSASASPDEGAQAAPAATESLALQETPAEPIRRSHPLLVGLGSFGIALLVSLICSGCVSALAASLYSSGAVKVDAQEAADALRQAADEAVDEWRSLWWY